MYHSFTVRIPDVKGKIVTMKKGQSTYVLYQYGSVYNPEKNTPFQSVPLSAKYARMILGACIPTQTL